MNGDIRPSDARNWKSQLPTLTLHQLTLREPEPGDCPALMELLSLSDASRFGVEEPITEANVRALVDRARSERAAGVSFSYAITLADNQPLVGLVQVRQLDPAFEAAEWEITLSPHVRGTGIFLDVARLVGSFAFRTVGTHRLEVRALLQNGRANGALRKLGAVQEGILRRAVRRGGQYVDQALWSILKDDWADPPPQPGARVH
jgi:RimJ/RimL family protein N-acetyltransferase